MSNHTPHKPVCEYTTSELEYLDMGTPVIEKTAIKLEALRKDLSAFEYITTAPRPSFRTARDIIRLVQQIIFPGYFARNKNVSELNIKYTTGQILSSLFDQLSNEICSAIRHDFLRNGRPCVNCQKHSRALALELIKKLPDLRRILASDVLATMEGDPAAGGQIDQIIFCYPGVFATLVYRLAHELWSHGVPFVPRILTEYAHSKTGIDIHPGASIGKSFFIDHGTGVVIGETTIIGQKVRIYQGVTLGALSLPKDAGTTLLGQKRHPTLEDDVIVYSGATILGGDTTIGARSIIGGNVWLTESIPPDTRVLIKKPELVMVNSKKK